MVRVVGVVGVVTEVTVVRVVHEGGEDKLMYMHNVNATYTHQ